MVVVGITGGIGSGKSVICRILQAMGYPVYDCDSCAKALMDYSLEIKNAIAREISPDAITPDGAINRPHLSEIVFSSPKHLETLNSIVHSAVRADIAKWISRQQAPIAFIESAIIYTSGLHLLVNDIWLVSAPLDVRVDRVIMRNGISRRQVLDRVKSQECEFSSLSGQTKEIVNDGATPLLCQIHILLAGYLS